MSKTIVTVCGLVVGAVLGPAACVGDAGAPEPIASDVVGGSSPPVASEEQTERTGEVEEPYTRHSRYVAYMLNCILWAAAGALRSRCMAAAEKLLERCLEGAE